MFVEITNAKNLKIECKLGVVQRLKRGLEVEDIIHYYVNYLLKLLLFTSKQDFINSKQLITQSTTPNDPETTLQ